VTVTWRELPPDAPEPPPLSVVRDVGGLTWARAFEGPTPWGPVGVWPSVELPRPHAWVDLAERGPVLLGEPEGVPWPLVESVEPSGYEIRDRALGHAVRRLNGWEPGDVTTDLDLAEHYERWLRDGER